MRRRIQGVLVAAVAALSGLTGSPALAAPQETVTEYNAGLECTGMTTDGQAVRLLTGSSAQFGDGLTATIGDEDAPVATVFGVEGGWSGDTIAFQVEVYTGGGGGQLAEPGLGSFTATTTVVSSSEHTVREGSGNQRVRGTIVTAVLTADATLTIPGFTVPSLECNGTSTTGTYTANNPASTVRFERIFYDSARCVGNATVSLFGPVDGEYWLDVSVGTPNNQYNLFGAVPEPKQPTFTAVLPLRNSQTAEYLGDFEVTVTLSPKELPTKTLLRTSTARITEQSRLYDVSARVSLPWMEVDSTCGALEVLTSSVIRSSEGPKPTDNRPGNDAPADARRLAVGDTTQMTTRGAAIDPEAAMACAVEPGRTVWYSFIGTGDLVSLDTAGSAFDTTLAVYEMDDGDLQEVACGDDVVNDYPYPLGSLQAQVALPTVAGRVYYVQVGGAFADYGRLRLTLR